MYWSKDLGLSTDSRVLVALNSTWRFYRGRNKYCKLFWHLFGLDVHFFWHNLYIRRLPGPSPRSRAGFYPCLAWKLQVVHRQTRNLTGKNLSNLMKSYNSLQIPINPYSTTCDISAVYRRGRKFPGCWVPEILWSELMSAFLLHRKKYMVEFI